MIKSENIKKMSKRHITQEINKQGFQQCSMGYTCRYGVISLKY